MDVSKCYLAKQQHMKTSQHSTVVAKFSLVLKYCNFKFRTLFVQLCKFSMVPYVVEFRKANLAYA